MSCPHPEKKRYGNKRAAWRDAIAMQRKGASVDLKPYPCRCGAFHIGHSVSSLMFRIRKARRAGRA